MEPLIYDAEPSDADAIADAWYAMMEQAGLLRERIPPRWREGFIAHLLDGMQDGSQYWLVARDHGSVVATGGAIVRRNEWSITPPRAVIVGMYVRPSHRRRGIARAILTRLLQRCREQGFTEVRLQATAQGRPLYASVGFVPSDEMVLRYGAGIDA